MKVEITGGGDLSTNARPVITLTASNSADAAVLLRFAAIVASGVDADQVLLLGVDKADEI